MVNTIIEQMSSSSRVAQRSDAKPPVAVATAAGAARTVSLISLIVFTPLALGAAPRWAFCIALWLAGFSFLAMLSRRLGEGLKPLPASTIDGPVVLFLVLAAVSLAVSIYPAATLWAVWRLLLYLAVFYLTLDVTETRDGLHLWVRILTVMGMAVAMIGLIQYFGGTLPGLPRDAGGHSFLHATFRRYNHAAGYLEMTLALGLGMWLHVRPRYPAIYLSGLALMLIALCLTKARGGWLGASAALVFLGAVYLRTRNVSRAWIAAGISVLVLIIGLTFLSSMPLIKRLQTMDDPDDPSFTARIEVAKSSLTLIGDAPLLGTGLGTFPWAFPRVRPPGLASRWLEAHNDYLQLAVEMGLTALIPLAWGLVLLWRRGLAGTADTRSRTRRGARLGALAAVVAMLVHSLFDFNLQITANGVLMSCLLAIAVGSHGSRAEGATIKAVGS